MDLIFLFDEAPGSEQKQKAAQMPQFLSSLIQKAVFAPHYHNANNQKQQVRK